jgi:tetratricopeptide (TPR) repeat protein
MNRPDPSQIRRWQEEVARDPGCPAFLPLAESYLRDGRLEVARRLCLRGLERGPDLPDAHHLLGRVYQEAGELEQAADEWDIALRLDPRHGPARRALGYLCLELREWAAAVRHLEVVAATAPADRRLADALGLARSRLAESGGPPAEAGPRERSGQLLGPPLERFVRETRVRFALLIDGSGRILGQQGFTRDLDLASFASLAAGIQAASRALALMLDQPGFGQLFQGAGERQLFLGACPTPLGETLLLSGFGAESPIGLVRVGFRGFLADVAAISAWPAPAGRPDAERFEQSLAAGLQGAYRGMAGARPGNG